MLNVTPVSLDRNRVEKEINTLSNEFHEQPVSINWMSPRKGIRRAVIALWGQARLHELVADSLSIVAAGKSPHQGLLLDYLGNLQWSAQNRLPVYQITGG